MPKKPPRKCSRYGCNVLTHDRYCRAHAAQQAKECSRWKKTTTTSAAVRGYGVEWQKLRDAVMRRDGGLCVPCLDLGLETRATSVDHIRPKSQGGTDDMTNLQAICHRCHARKTRADRKEPAKRVNGCSIS